MLQVTLRHCAIALAALHASCRTKGENTPTQTQYSRTIGRHKINDNYDWNGRGPQPRAPPHNYRKRGMYPKLRHPSCIPDCPASAVFRQNCKNLRKGIVTSVVFDCVACIPHFGNLKGCDARSLQGPRRRNTEARIVNRGQAGKQRSAGCRGLSRHS